MTLPKSVIDAVDNAENHCGLSLIYLSRDEWQTIRDHLMIQESEISAEQAAHAYTRTNRDNIESRLAAADALTSEWRYLVMNHNAGCEAMCDPDRCKYRPYLEANGRRCPECPINDMIEIPGHLREGDAAQKFRFNPDCKCMICLGVQMGSESLGMLGWPNTHLQGNEPK